MCEVTTTTERRQSDRQARTEVKRFSLVRCMKQRPTVFPNGKATVGVGYGNCARDAAEVEEPGMPGDGRVEELAKRAPRRRKEGSMSRSDPTDAGCSRDGGWPSGAALQGEAPNHRELRRSRAEVVSVAEKAHQQCVR